MKTQSSFFAGKFPAKIIASLLLFFSLTLSASLNAQTVPAATVDDSGKIVLDKTAPLSATYVADVKHYSNNLTGQAQGQAYVEQLFGKDYISLSLNYTTKKLTITLDLSNPATAGWTVANWNNHLRTN